MRRPGGTAAAMAACVPHPRGLTRGQAQQGAHGRRTVQQQQRNIMALRVRWGAAIRPHCCPTNRRATQAQHRRHGGYHVSPAAGQSYLRVHHRPLGAPELRAEAGPRCMLMSCDAGQLCVPQPQAASNGVRTRPHQSTHILALHRTSYWPPSRWCPPMWICAPHGGQGGRQVG